MNNLKQLNILYVEDDDFIRENTCELFKKIWKTYWQTKAN